MDLKNKVVLITGGSSGLGLATAKLMLAKEAKVVICGRDLEKLNAVKTELNSQNLFIEKCDITIPEEVKTMFSKLSGLDVLINSAGIFLEGLLESNPDDKIEDTVNINLTGTILVTKYALPLLKKAPQGWIMNISSTVGTEARGKYAAYAASKYGVRGFTDSLKNELADTQIRVTGFYPGTMDTPLFKTAGLEKDTQTCMSPDEVAKIISFIIETPENIHIDHIVIRNRGKQVNKN